MPRSKAGKNQARRQKAGLKKLRDLGLISKFDARKKPSRSQRAALTRFSDVLAGKARVVTPANPKSFKGVFRVIGKRVIVPRRKGETISVNKSGEIVSRRKSGTRKIVGKFTRADRGEKIERPKRATQYAVPFLRGSGEVEWQRFPDYDMLKKFMEGYNYSDWPDYVVEEFIDDEDDEKLQRKLDRKMRKLKKARAKTWGKADREGARITRQRSSRLKDGRKRSGHLRRKRGK